jgi:hypothetical protein
MKAKLIKTIDGYHLRSLIKDIPRSINVYHKISKTEGEFGFGEHSGKLSKQNCDEIFGVVDVEKLAEEYCTHKPKNVKELRDVNLIKLGFRDGFNKAMELNKMFTLEDMRNAMDWIMTQYFEFHEQPTIGRREQYLESLQQPTEMDVEIEMREDYLMWKHSDIEKMSDCLVPKLDSEGCLILKKI